MLILATSVQLYESTVHGSFDEVCTEVTRPYVLAIWRNFRCAKTDITYFVSSAVRIPLFADKKLFPTAMVDNPDGTGNFDFAFGV